MALARWAPGLASARAEEAPSRGRGSRKPCRYRAAIKRQVARARELYLLDWCYVVSWLINGLALFAVLVAHEEPR